MIVFLLSRNAGLGELHRPQRHSTHRPFNALHIQHYQTFQRRVVMPGQPASVVNGRIGVGGFIETNENTIDHGKQRAAPGVFYKNHINCPMTTPFSLHKLRIA